MDNPISNVRLTLLAALLLLLVGCVFASSNAPAANDSGEQSDAIKNVFVVCTKARNAACTMQIDPVCATRDTGIRCIRAPCPSSEQVTFDNACVACADSKVSGYVAGACPEIDEDNDVEQAPLQ